MQTTTKHYLINNNSLKWPSYVSSELTDLKVGNLISETYDQGVPDDSSPSTDLPALMTVSALFLAQPGRWD